VGQLKHGAQILIATPFMAQADEESCSACKICADRCPTGAIEIDEFARIKNDLCIGCGVCVPTCSTQSMRLVRRPGAQ
jgi:NAD-dependent dihydropyrimidine dehydrogenase PreA subunit